MMLNFLFQGLLGYGMIGGNNLHSFSTNVERGRYFFYLAIASISIAGLINSLLTVNQWFPWLQKFSITTVAVFTVLYIIFNKVVWKWIAAVHIPNLNGTWTGTLKTSYSNFVDEHEAVIEIVQTWTKICVTGKFNQSISFSKIACLEVDEARIILHYSYQNERKPDTTAETAVMHNGFATLIFDTKTHSISGSYYNNPATTNGNHGVLLLEKKSG